MVPYKYFSFEGFYQVRIFSCSFKHSDAKWYFGYKMRITVAKWSPANISLLMVSYKCGFFHASSNIQMQNGISVTKYVFRLQNVLLQIFLSWKLLPSADLFMHLQTCRCKMVIWVPKCVFRLLNGLLLVFLYSRFLSSVDFFMHLQTFRCKMVISVTKCV